MMNFLFKYQTASDCLATYNRLTAVTDPLNHGTSFGYDAGGNLTSIQGPISSIPATVFWYNASGQGVSVTTQFLYDGVNAVRETSATTANLLTGLGIDEVFTRTDSSGTRHFLTDALGSTLALADGAGAVQTQYTYEPFGQATVNGPSSANPFQYTSRENDGTGLYYYRARYYHPGLQRFISEDPTEFSGGVNMYAYVGNDPLKMLDPSGLSSLVFNRSSGTLTVIDGNGNVVGVYLAGNFTTNPRGNPNTIGSNGPAPSGTFPVQAPVSTGSSPAYGPYFFPIGAPGSIVRQRGIGIHGGRSGPTSKTLGCIRVSNETAQILHQL